MGVKIRRRDILRYSGGIGTSDVSTPRSETPTPDASGMQAGLNVGNFKEALASQWEGGVWVRTQLVLGPCPASASSTSRVSLPRCSLGINTCSLEMDSTL
jgi:hypothetical protein